MSAFMAVSIRAAPINIADMGIVPACMHHTFSSGYIGNIVRFHNGQGVDIRPERDAGPWQPAYDISHHARARAAKSSSYIFAP